MSGWEAWEKCRRLDNCRHTVAPDEMATRIPDQERILESKVARREAREAGGREALERRKAYTRETGLDVDEAAQETEEVTVEQRKPAPGSTSKHKAQGGEESDDEDAAAAAADAAPGEVPAGGAAKKVNVVKRLKGEEEASKLDQVRAVGRWRRRESRQTALNPPPLARPGHGPWVHAGALQPPPRAAGGLL